MISDRSNYNSRTIKYQWYNYQHQNEMVVDMLTTNPSFLQQDKGTSPPFFLEIIDAYYLNILRPDEHRTGDVFPGKWQVFFLVYILLWLQVIVSHFPGFVVSIWFRKFAPQCAS
jgi:hypothetical protein